MTNMTKAQLVDENIALRHSLNLLEQQLASLRAAPQPQVQRTANEEQIVSTYTKRDGSRWNKVRIGYNTFAHRPARVFHVVAGKYDGDEENCKFSDTRDTLEEAEALLLTVNDYPWSRIETV